MPAGNIRENTEFNIQGFSFFLNCYESARVYYTTEETRGIKHGPSRSQSENQPKIESGLYAYLKSANK